MYHYHVCISSYYVNMISSGRTWSQGPSGPRLGRCWSRPIGPLGPTRATSQSSCSLFEKSSNAPPQTDLLLFHIWVTVSFFKCQLVSIETWIGLRGSQRKYKNLFTTNTRTWFCSTHCLGTTTWGSLVQEQMQPSETKRSQLRSQFEEPNWCWQTTTTTRIRIVISLEVITSLPGRQETIQKGYPG